jgi:hypothetical protein
MNGIAQPAPMAHEYCGIVEEAFKAVTSIKPANSPSARSLLLTTAIRTATMAISPPANSRELIDLLERPRQSLHGRGVDASA